MIAQIARMQRQLKSWQMSPKMVCSFWLFFFSALGVTCKMCFPWKRNHSQRRTKCYFYNYRAETYRTLRVFSRFFISLDCSEVSLSPIACEKDNALWAHYSRCPANISLTPSPTHSPHQRFHTHLSLMLDPHLAPCSHKIKAVQMPSVTSFTFCRTCFKTNLKKKKNGKKWTSERNTEDVTWPTWTQNK